mgnify:CR=1 FL=1
MMDNLSQEKLKELESKCIQEEEPWCTAMCPIHIDARQLCKLVSEGNFTEGRKLYEKRVIFPNIISRVCEQNCKEQCRRKGLGNSINIRNLELACMTYGKKVKSRVLLKPKKKEIIEENKANELASSLKEEESTINDKTPDLPVNNPSIFSSTNHTPVQNNNFQSKEILPHRDIPQNPGSDGTACGRIPGGRL